MFVIIRSCKWFNTKALTFDVDIFLAVLGAQWCWFNWRFNLRFLWNRSSFGRVWKILENLADFLIRFTFNGIARTWLRKWREILVQNSNFFFRIDHLLAETQTCAAAEQRAQNFVWRAVLIPFLAGNDTTHAELSHWSKFQYPLSDTIVIEPFETCTCFQVQDLIRKVMLYPFQPGKFAVVDPMRSRIPIPQVLVPVSPQVGEMVSVQGGDEELWRAEVRAVDHGHKTIRGYFFVKHHQWNENQLWKRESMGHAMDTIHFKSIVSILDGQWHGPYWKDNGY